VFIRTVNRYSEVKDDKAGLPTVVGGTAHLSVEGTHLIEGKHDSPQKPVLAVYDHVVAEKNKCGCTNFCVKIMIAVATILFVVFVGAAIAVGRGNESASSGLWAVGIIALIVSIVGCNILYCACFQSPKGADE
jgi:lysylphosphatidylglycerol synthetase-like protein (DUF2156 family)